MSAPGHASRHAPRSVRIAWLTVSDSRSAETDTAGAGARRLIEAAGHHVADYAIVPDEPERVREHVMALLGGDCDAMIVSGGTGVSTRDRTYEALAVLLDPRLDGFGELFRMLSHAEIGSAAMLSRAVGGIARGKPLFVVPGSPAAVTLALERLILPVLAHLLSELRRPPDGVS